ncbi:C4-dicarboxylate ABC transporter, partial [Paenibacillus polymyxa]|nr:C4-dicarboxylate ABC transporter [Paenibacillus polymyxa]
IYGLLPLLPIVLLLLIFFLNLVIGTKLNMSVQMVTLISFVVAVFVELLAKRKAQAVLKETGTFFTGMGDVMSIVALLVAA